MRDSSVEETRTETARAESAARRGRVRANSLEASEKVREGRQAVFEA